MRIREATRDDITAMMQVRLAVRENRLVSLVISEADYIEAIETTGRGWVAMLESQLVGFAIGNRFTGNIWALFVLPDFERRGIGRRLHDLMVAWLWSTGLDRLTLSTAPGTRAVGFYEAAGWVNVGITGHGEVAFELRRAH